MKKAIVKASRVKDWADLSNLVELNLRKKGIKNLPIAFGELTKL